MMALQIDDGPDEAFDEYWDETTADVYRQDAVVDELREKYRRYFGELASVAPNSNFLDVGSGAGISVDTAGSEFGFQARGIEPSQRAVDLARGRFGVDVVCGLLDAESELPRDFGALTLWDVIEHVEDPESLLKLCASHLAEGGVFLLETPDEGALLRRLIRGFGALGIGPLDLRGSIYYRAHRYYFTQRAMRKLLERCGFRDIRFHSEHSMYQKELLYMQRFGSDTGLKKLGIQCTAWMTDIFPTLGNKMVVTAIKAS
jgi:2-polyprenyl-3-methyl-5-hydroxy-6-metoxy-1,4-benzoquinol methylase